MALTAPVGAKTFYEDGLNGLKAALEQINGSTGGMLTVLSALPTDIDSGSWAVMGAGADGNVGSAVLGYALLTSISAIVPGNEEGGSGSGEFGWKLTFSAVNNVAINTTGTAVALGLIVGRDTFAGGSDIDARYIVDLSDLGVTLGNPINIPTWDIEIEYGTNAA